jgi:carotenoid cleavage dioxygenase-like enzyme
MPSLIENTIRKSITQGAAALHRFNRERMAAPDTPNPFLTGPNQPLQREVTLERPPVSGQIPPQLDGCYARIGPNPVTPVNPANHHWFMGDGMVHGVRLHDGQALWYRNRWIRSTQVSRALGEAPAPGPRHHSDTVNTNVLAIAGKPWALVEAGGFPVELDERLDTIAHNPFGGSLKGSFSAHPHRDTTTGALHAICYDARDPNTLRHVVVGADGVVQREEPIAVQHGPSVHDCMITEHHVIVLDLPVTFSMTRYLAGYGFPYVWNPQHPARVGVLAKTAPGRDIVWCEVEPCYVFHPSNAFETEDGRITLDVVAYATMFDESRIGPAAGSAKFERWNIDLGARQVSRRVLDTQPQEFPRIDERYTGKPYRHAYTVQLRADARGEFVPDQVLIHHDLQDGTRQVHDFGPGRLVSEFVFEPRHAGAAEGDGWLMGYVVDAAQRSSEFVILDTRQFGGAPVATVAIAHAIPLGFHGNWMPAVPAA